MSFFIFLLHILLLYLILQLAGDQATRNALHVSPKVQKWQSCNNAVNALFAGDWMKNYQQVFVPMLEDGIRVLIYAGDVDFVCNWLKSQY